MNEKELQNIWDKFTNKFDVSQLGLDYEKFKLKMNTLDKRKKFFDKYSQSLGLGDYENYEKSISLPTPQPPKPSPSVKVDETKFSCIKNSNTKGKNLQQTKDNPEAYSFFNTDGSEFTFWVNGDFTYYDGDTTANGKWKCNGGNNFEANVDWKGTTHYFKSETNEWALTQNAKKTVYENTIKKIVSKNLKSLTK
jgi:hypothetical protein